MKIDRAQKAMKAVLKTIPWEGECLKNWLEQFDGLKQTKKKSHAGSRMVNNVFVKKTTSQSWRHRNQLSFLTRQMETQKTLWVQEESQIGSRRQINKTEWTHTPGIQTGHYGSSQNEIQYISLRVSEGTTEWSHNTHGWKGHRSIKEGRQRKAISQPKYYGFSF